MNEPRVPVLIRIRASLKAQIGKLATKQHRSTNQQIEFLLERALELMGESTEELPSPGEERKRKRSGE